MAPFVLNMLQVIVTLPELLDDLAALRLQIEMLERQKKELESMIAPLAKEQVQANREQIGKKDTHILIRTDRYSFTYQERLDRKALNSHQDMESVLFDIETQKELAERENADAIAKDKKIIDKASVRINKLSQTSEGRSYERERDEIVARLTPQFMSPVLVFKSY